MAGSVADNLTGIVAQGGEKIASNIQSGAQLAQGIEQVQMQRQQMEQQKQELQLNKAQKVISAIQAGDNFKDKAAQSNYYKKVIPSMVRVFKLEDVFSPDLMEMVQVSPDVRQKVLGLQLDVQDKVQKGELRGADIMSYVKSKLTPEELPLLDTDVLMEQQKFSAGEEGKAYRGKLVADAAAGRQQTQIEAAPETEYKKDVAKVAANYNTQGGAAGVAKNVAKMRGVIDKLKSNDIKLGTLAKNIPYGSTEEVLSRIDPKAKAAMDDVRGAINLRAALADPNPTAMQVNSIMSRAFDPRLSNSENVKKLEEAIVELETAAKDREQEFKKFGFAQKSAAPSPGKDGRAWLSGQSSSYKKLPQDQQMKFIEGAAKKFDIPLEDVKKALGVK